MLFAIMVLNNKNKGLIVFLIVVTLAVIGGLVFYFIGKQAIVKSLADDQENRELLKDSLYYNYTTRSLDIAEVHGFVKSVKMECTDMNGKTSFDVPSPFNSVWYSFDKKGEIDSLYSDKALVTHQGSHSIIANKTKIEGEERGMFENDHLRYDIFDYVFDGEKMTSAIYSHILCDDLRGELSEMIVDYTEYRDDKYHKKTITEPMYYGSIKTTIDYTYTKTDSMGNWIERIGEVTKVYSHSPNEIDRFKVKETRTISYYEKKDVDLEKLLDAPQGQESTNSDVYNEINRVQRLVKNNEMQANQDQYDSQYVDEPQTVDNSTNTTSSTIDLYQLTTGQWYADDSDTETDWWYTYMSDGTGRLKVSVPNFNTPINATFTWSISNGVLSVRWDSDLAALAGTRGWNGEIRKLNNEIMEIYDNRSYSRDVYKHIR